MKGRLLMVDDDPNILESAKDILEDADYQVSIVSTVQSALEQLRAQPPDVLLLDFNLPDGNGLELARAAHALQPTLKIILMSGQDRIDLAPAEGAITRLLPKPVSPTHLLATLQELLKNF